MTEPVHLSTPQAPFTFCPHNPAGSDGPGIRCPSKTEGWSQIVSVFALKGMKAGAHDLSDLANKKLLWNAFQSAIANEVVFHHKLDLWLSRQSPKFSSKKINTARVFKCGVIMK